MDRLEKLMVLEAALLACGDELNKIMFAVGSGIDSDQLEDFLGKQLEDCKQHSPSFGDYLNKQKAAIIKLSKAPEVFGYGS